MANFGISAIYPLYSSNEITVSVWHGDNSLFLVVSVTMCFEQCNIKKR